MPRRTNIGNLVPLVVVEGVTNSGKSTLIEALSGAAARQGGQVDSVSRLLDQEATMQLLARVTGPVANAPFLDPRTELFLYIARLARKFHVATLQLERNPDQMVLMDRGVASVIAYAEVVLGLSPADVEPTVMLADPGRLSGSSLALYLDVPEVTMMDRARRSPLSRKDEGVRSAFTQYAATLQSATHANHGRVVVLDGTQTPAQVKRSAASALDWCAA